jgi:hypothetical protein
MELSKSQNLERSLQKIAETPIKDLSSCSSQLLQKVQDRVSKGIIYNQATASSRTLKLGSDFSTSLQATQSRDTAPVGITYDQAIASSTSPQTTQSRDRASTGIISDPTTASSRTLNLGSDFSTSLQATQSRDTAPIGITYDQATASSTSPQTTQSRDRASIGITYDQAIASSTSPQTTQSRDRASTGIISDPTTASSRTLNLGSDFSTSPQAAQSQTIRKVNSIIQRLLDQITHVSEFLKNDVEKILRNGIRPCCEDPRIEDVGKLLCPTEFDELRFILGCLSLFDEYEQFASTASKKKKHGSQRAFGATLGIDHSGTRKLRYGIDCGRILRTLARNYGYGITAFLLFVKWHGLKKEEMVRFGRLCLREEKTIKLIPVTEKFITDCFCEYQRVVQERRNANSKKSILQKRKRKTTDIPAIFQQPQSILGLPLKPTEGILTGKGTSIATSHSF